MTELKALINRLRPVVAPLWLHASGQAITWTVVATHDASKWEAAISTLAVAAVTSALRRISAWAGLPAPKA